MAESPNAPLFLSNYLQYRDSNKKRFIQFAIVKQVLFEKESLENTYTDPLIEIIKKIRMINKKNLGTAYKKIIRIK